MAWEPSEYAACTFTKKTKHRKTRHHEQAQDFMMIRGSPFQTAKEPHAVLCESAKVWDTRMHATIMFQFKLMLMCVELTQIYDQYKQEWKQISSHFFPHKNCKDADFAAKCPTFWPWNWQRSSFQWLSEVDGTVAKKTTSSWHPASWRPTSQRSSVESGDIKLISNRFQTEISLWHHWIISWQQLMSCHYWPRSLFILLKKRISLRRVIPGSCSCLFLAFLFHPQQQLPSFELVQASSNVICSGHQSTKNDKKCASWCFTSPSHSSSIFSASKGLTSAVPSNVWAAAASAACRPPRTWRTWPSSRAAGPGCCSSAWESKTNHVATWDGWMGGSSAQILTQRSHSNLANLLFFQVKWQWC